MITAAARLPSRVEPGAAPALPADDRPRDRWLGVEIRHLVALQAIAREGSFSAAAESLDYVQSAVSQQLVQLERLVDARLVERSRGVGRVALTDAGALVLEHAQDVLACLENIAPEVATVAPFGVRPLRLGCFTSVGCSLAPLAVHAFRERHPDGEITLTETATDSELFDRLGAAALDLAFCELPPVAGPFETTRLLRDPFVVLAALDSPLVTDGGPPSLAELGRVPLVGYHRSRSQGRVVKVLRANGVEPRFAHRSQRDSVIQAFVASGAGAAIVPRLTVSRPPPGTVVLEPPGLPARTLGLAWCSGRQLPVAAEAFVDTALSVSAELDVPACGRAEAAGAVA